MKSFFPRNMNRKLDMLANSARRRGVPSLHNSHETWQHFEFLLTDLKENSLPSFANKKEFLPRAFHVWQATRKLFCHDENWHEEKTSEIRVNKERSDRILRASKNECFTFSSMTLTHIETRRSLPRDVIEMTERKLWFRQNEFASSSQAKTISPISCVKNSI